MKKILLMSIAFALIAVAALSAVSMKAQAAPENGWEQSASGEWRYYQDAEAVTGWVLYQGHWYFLDSAGVMQTGWLYDNGYWYYLGGNGKMRTGWQLTGNKWYYLGGNGKMRTGWLLNGGKWYYLGSSGAMRTGWIQDQKWYYLGENGVMKTGWLKDNGKWYYLGGNGAMRTGWINDQGTWYYLSNNGVMQTGWVKSGGKWYYLNKKGAMQTGWLQLKEKWYYLAESGAMVTGEQVIDGQNYTFSSSGVLQENAYDSSLITADIASYARDVFYSVTNDSMSPSDKLRALFNHVGNRNVYPYDLNRIPHYTGTDWPVVYAQDMMYYGASDCHGDAALFGYLAKLCGVSDHVYWCSNGAHAWVEIDGLIYDPVFLGSANYKYTSVFGWTYAEGISNSWLGAGYASMAGNAGTFRYLEVPRF